MRYLSLGFGIIVLSLTVLQCKTGGKGGGGVDQGKGKPESSAATPPLTSKEEAVAAIQSASAQYVNSHACQNAASHSAAAQSPSCEAAKALSDPDNATKIEDTIQNTPSTDVAVVNETVAEQLVEQPVVADNTIPTVVDTPTPSTPEVTPTHRYRHRWWMQRLQQKSQHRHRPNTG
jgi:hypothetical protein